MGHHTTSAAAAAASQIRPDAHQLLGACAVAAVAVVPPVELCTNADDVLGSTGDNGTVTVALSRTDGAVEIDPASAAGVHR
jgi:hypothetical protein